MPFCPRRKRSAPARSDMNSDMSRLSDAGVSTDADGLSFVPEARWVGFVSDEGTSDLWLLRFGARIEHRSRVEGGLFFLRLGANPFATRLPLRLFRAARHVHDNG